VGLLLALLPAAFLPAGGQVEGAKAGKPAAPVKIQFWHDWAPDGAQGLVLQKLLDEFNAANASRISVGTVYMGGKRAEKMGVKMGKDGSLFLPIRIEAGNGNGLNLVPIDFLVKAFMEIMDTSLEGGVFHIVNQRPKTIDELVNYATRYFNLEGLQAVHEDAFLEKSRNGLEILFDTYVEAYKPYMADARIFNNEKTRSILEKKGIQCPDLDYEVFSKCMEYAIETGWGTTLFGKQRG